MKQLGSRFLFQNLKLKLIVLVFYSSMKLFGQCPANGAYYASSQKEVDDFIINYPNCTEIDYLYVGGNTNITNLKGFSNLSKINSLNISGISITNFQGLNNVTSIGMFAPSSLSKITCFEGFDKLERIDNFNSSSLPISNFKGFESLTSVGTFAITEFNNLVNFEGLENLQTIDGESFYILNCSSITDIYGLDCYFFSEEFKNTLTYYIDSRLKEIADECCDDSTPTSLNDINRKEVKFYPNPVKGTLKIENYKEVQSVKIMDLSGKLILTQYSNCNSINMHNIKSGLYIIECKLVTDQVIYGKIIVQ